MILLFLMTALSSTIIFLNHPLSVGFLILIQTILTCLIMGSIYINFWYSYILILIMIGGLLILFIYMTSIASNEKFKFNINMLVFTLTIMFMMMMMYKFYPSLLMEMFFNKEMNIKILNNETFQLSMSKLYNFPEMKIMLMTIFYLLLCMIAVVKICKINSGPLRQMFYENT
uniref:NADH-ubiquinone oxidoreductase chain 6 n=1 Tax=Cryptolaemus montrouzieri TaxID=559131 RepID=A0A109XW62_9CUCU|nr:NADH dehydrogenase subunit 6 [Cryptolaemus montrouzieri]